MNETLVDAIDQLLPQTQCRRCDYPGCRPYAEAIAQGLADIDQCPPGGDAGVHAIANLLERPAKPMNRAHGAQKALAYAWIDEQTCIGCTKCIQACPVDAIIGAAKKMHTVFREECTGCELCVAPCPVDCIYLIDPAEPEPQSIEHARALAQAFASLPDGSRWQPVPAAKAQRARMRFHARNQRLTREQREREERLSAPAEPDSLAQYDPIQAAIARAKARRQAKPGAAS